MKPDPEMQQMPKRSIKADRAKAMIGGVPKKPSVAKGPTGGPTGRRAGRRAGSSDIAKKGAPLNIPMKDVSSDFKRLVVEELIRTGRARIVKRKGGKVWQRRRRRRGGNRRRSKVGSSLIVVKFVNM